MSRRPSAFPYVNEVLTPGCRCGWKGTSTRLEADAERELRAHGYTHVDAGEWPATYVEGTPTDPADLVPVDISAGE